MATKKDIAKNSAFNIVATAIPLAILQLIVLPLMNTKLGDEPYGLVVTLISLFTLFPAVFGNTLNNVRIIRDLEYEEEGLVGDFNPLAIILASASMILTGVVGLLYIGYFNIFDAIGLVICAGLFFFDSYYSVGFLIHLNYKRILIVSIIKSAGYFAGLALFILTGFWYWVYIAAYLLSCVYIALNTSLIREPLRLTSRFKRTLGEESLLLIAAFLKDVTAYADRLLLFPILGGAAVAIYYVATLLGKLTSMVISPVSSVLLSYMGRTRQIESKNVKALVAVSAGVGAMIYVLCLLVSKPALEFLYPSLVDEAMGLIVITYAASVVSAMVSILNPLVLRFCNIAWQIILSIISIISYLVFGLVFLSLWGMTGFAIGVLCSTVVSLVARIIIIYAKREQITGKQ